MRHARGLTLLELVLILFIIGILAAILFPLFATVGECSWRGTCSGHFRQLGTAFNQYAADYDGFYPGGRNYAAALPQGRPVSASALIVDDRARDWPARMLPYIKREVTFYCTSEPFCSMCGARVTPEARAKYASSYMMNGWVAFGLNTDAIRSPEQFVLLAERNTAGLDPDSPYLVSWWNWQQKGNGFAWPPASYPIPIEQAAHDISFTRHKGMENYGFADGHVKAMRFEQAWSAAKPTAFWPESQ